MKKFAFLLMILLFGLALTACGSAQTSGRSNQVERTEENSPTQALQQPSTERKLTLQDTQGAVTVEVTPENLENPGDQLTFDISMNTHSVDLRMDLATLSTLTTDNGRSVDATLWDAEPGGHHVSGKLLFPASLDGKDLLDGATELTLTIKNVDAPERVFTWKLQ